MKTHVIAILCIAGLMTFNALLEPAKRAAQAEYLAEHLTERYQIEKYEAWDFFSEVLKPPFGVLALAVESIPYLGAIALILILKRKQLLHE